VSAQELNHLHRKCTVESDNIFGSEEASGEVSAKEHHTHRTLSGSRREKLTAVRQHALLSPGLAMCHSFFLRTTKTSQMAILQTRGRDSKGADGSFT
jgi:hypothetical protein